MSSRGQYCGVPQCNIYRKSGISMHQIPRSVINNRKELLKWKIALKMGKPFPKYFSMCSRHFKKEQILTPLSNSKRKKSKLLNSAFPTENLPQASWSAKICARQIKARYNRLRNRNAAKLWMQRSPEVNRMPENIELNTLLNDDISHSQQSKFKSVGVQYDDIMRHKSVQVDVDLQYNDLPFRISNNYELNSMTGIPTIKLLNAIVNCCSVVRPSEKANIGLSLKHRIVLTLFRIKTNMTYAQTANLFKLNVKTVTKYFIETVQLLSKVLESCIYWQTKEENLKSLPKCFTKFANTMTVLDCTEIKTIQFRCLTCRTCTYSHYKSSHTVKILIGVSPSGLVNFISTAVGGRTSDKAIFNITNLSEKLKPGDAVMVDKGFLISNELAEGGIEMIRPAFLSHDRTSLDIERDRLIAAARVHVERRISRIKQFKMLSEKVTLSVLPYLDEIVTIVCAISNLSKPILNDDKF